MLFHLLPALFERGQEKFPSCYVGFPETFSVLLIFTIRWMYAPLGEKLELALLLLRSIKLYHEHLLILADASGFFNYCILNFLICFR